MLVKELIAHLRTLDPEAKLLVADYYYSDREGFQDTLNDLKIRRIIKRPSDTPYHQHYDEQGNVYLFDTRGV